LTTVLVADDSQVFREAVAAGLRCRGFNVRCAADGDEALRLLRQEHVALVILDLIMPRARGRDVLSEIRSDPATSDLPVVVATALRSPDCERALRPAVQGWLTKPSFSLKQLLRCVDLALAVSTPIAMRQPAGFPAVCLGGVPTPLPGRAAETAGGALTRYCLWVQHHGAWQRVVTVAGPNQLEAYDRALAKLPEELNGSPVMFRESSMTPDGFVSGAC
jgi:CheY-like chemotaxis protein